MQSFDDLTNEQKEQVLRMNRLKSQHDYSDLEKIVVGDMKSPNHLLKELLATIHRDGGHYAQEHGLDKATKDAIDLILNERKEADEIKWMYESSSK